MKSSRPDILEYSFTQILNSFDGILVITDDDLNIEFANNPFLALVNLPEDEVIQKSLYVFFTELHTFKNKLFKNPAEQSIKVITPTVFCKAFYQLSFTRLYDADTNLTGYSISIKQQSVAHAENKHQNKYQALFKDVQDGIIIMDNSSRILEVNPAACDIFQIEPAVFQTLQVRHLFPHNSDSESDRLWTKFLKKGSMTGYYKFLLPNGEYRYIDFKAKTNFVEGQHLAVFTNVSDKKKAQEDLKTSEYQLKAIFDSTTQMIFLLDEQLRVLKLNNNTKRVIRKYTGNDDIVGQTIHDLFPELLDSLPEAEFYINRIFRGEVVSFERNFPSNSDNWYDVILSPVYNIYDEIRSICITCQETTLRKKAELSLASSEARFRSLVQNSSDLIAILDKKGNLSYSSSSFFKILGYKDQFLKGKNLSELIVDEDRVEFLKRLEKTVLSEQETDSLEFRILHADGYYVYLESIFNSQIANPFINGIVLNARDVTVRKYHENSLLLLERAINSSDNGIFITDSAKHDNPIIYANSAFEKITGYRKDEIEDQGFLKFLDIQNEYSNTILSEKRKKTSFGRVLVENIRKNGVPYWGELDISPVYNKDDIQSNFIGVINDITEEKNADDALKEIVNGMASVSEKDFFNTLVLYLKASIGCDIVFVAELTNARKLITRAFLQDGEMVGSTELEVGDSPWGRVIEEKNSVYSSEISKDFPKSNFLPNSYTCFCGVPLFSSTGETIGVLGIVNQGVMKDVKFGQSLLKLFSIRTSAELDRLRHLKTLTTSESKFRALAANSPDLILIYNLQNRSVEYINKQEFLGYSYKEISKDTIWMDAYHSTYLSKAQKQLIRAIKGELPTENKEDLLIVRKDGQLEWITNRITILEKKDNWISKVLITATVITERKDSEEALRESEDRLKTLTENTNDLLFSVDKNLVFTTMNTAFKEFVNDTYKLEANIGQHVSVIFQNQLNNQQWVKLLYESLTNKKMVTEVHVDTDLDFEVLLNPICKEDQKVIGVSVFARDITRRIKAEKAIKKTNFELDSFVYRASHDLRAPLRSVLGLLNLVEVERDDSVRQEYLKLANKSINKLDSFISDLTDFTRNSRLAIKPVKIDFEKLIDDTFERLQFMENASKVKVAKLVDTKPFASDITRISIIVQNLISNAIKYQNEYADTPYFEMGLQYLQHDLIEIWIIDNGRGIRPEFQAQAFEMFFRASSDSNGSGLGLYITKQVVEKLNGTIELKSAPGVGTEIRIKLPIVESLDD